jgi:hypothetical protein
LVYSGAFTLALLLALTLAIGSGLQGKSGYVVTAAVAALVLLPALIAYRNLLESAALFALGVVSSVSLKFHMAFRADHFGGAVGYRIAAGDLLLYGLIAWLLLRRSKPIRIHVYSPLLLAFCAYLVFALLSTAVSTDPELGMFQISALLQAFALFLFLSNFLCTRPRFRIFVAGLLASLVLQSVVALVQVYRPGALNLAFLGGVVSEELRIVRGRIDLPQVDLGVTVLGGAATERPTGLLIHPNVLGLYLVLTIPLAIGIWITDRGWLSWCGFFAAGLGSAALYYTLSRSSWAGLALAALLGAILCVWRGAARVSQAKALVMVLALLVGLCGLAAKADLIMERLTSTSSEALDFRSNLNRTALRMLVANPVSGVGFNNFVNHVQRYDTSGLSRIKPYPVHNLILMEFSEIGFLGGVCFLALFGAIFRLAWLSASSARLQGTRAFILITGCGLVGLLFGDLTNFVYRVPVMTSAVWAQISLLAALERRGDEIWSRK